MKILVTGAEGQLGRALLQAGGGAVMPVGAKLCDITKPEQVNACIRQMRPEVVIHCAAYTAVDLAETERDLCWEANVTGTKNVVAACAAAGAAVMVMSTDYVFSGEGTQPYETTAQRHALNQYGRSKIAAEDLTRQLERYFIVRTSWMFGDGSNFVKKICRLGREKDQISVVSDQIGSPTYAQDLARTLLELAGSQEYGTYHATNEGYCSWAELAEESLRLMRISAEILPVTSGEYPAAARRPLNSRLSKASLDTAGCRRLPHWREALARYIKQYGEGI